MVYNNKERIGKKAYSKHFRERWRSHVPWLPCLWPCLVWGREARMLNLRKEWMLAHFQAARAYFLSFMLSARFCPRVVSFLRSKGVNLLRKARFFFTLKSTGVYLFFLNSVLAASILFSLSTVRTLAIFFLTCLILVSFTWGWEETFDTLSWASSFWQDEKQVSYHSWRRKKQLRLWWHIRWTYAVLGEFLNELGLFVLSKLVSFHFIHFA